MCTFSTKLGKYVTLHLFKFFYLQLTFCPSWDNGHTFCSSLTDKLHCRKPTNCASEINRMEQKYSTNSLHSVRAVKLYSAPFSQPLFQPKNYTSSLHPHLALALSAYMYLSCWQLIKGSTCTAQPACQACQSSEWRDNDLTISSLIGIQRTHWSPHCRLNKHTGSRMQPSVLINNPSTTHLMHKNSCRSIL